MASILPRIELIRIAWRCSIKEEQLYGDSRSSVGLTRIEQLDRVLTFQRGLFSSAT
jgi:hypothetical protein